MPISPNNFKTIWFYDKLKYLSKYFVEIYCMNLIGYVKTPTDYLVDRDDISTSGYTHTVITVQVAVFVSKKKAHNLKININSNVNNNRESKLICRPTD